MGVITRAKKRRPEEEQELVDRISRLPDGVLGDIVTLLPTRDGARTQVLSSRWRHIWRSAPLNLDLPEPLRRNTASAISSALSAHPGPGRRLHIILRNCSHGPGAAATLDGWLRSPTIDGLRKLEILFDSNLLHGGTQPLPLPPSVLRFSSTLAVASFEGCVFPDCGNSNIASRELNQLLNQLSLVSVRISETSLHALLAGCSVLESLLLKDTNGFPRVQIMSTASEASVCVLFGETTG
ncbi:F-box/LRR-repeat protein At3g03360 [Setaria viridis]|uniref:F-box/LRR-repeat protein At3g03360 n=1 Tax=Setaria viridis TaxID=4556 RepID=UPI001493A445|nr:F-box/LRR-repeat protein At3g03360-like [Setaria viridis]